MSRADARCLEFLVADNGPSQAEKAIGRQERRSNDAQIDCNPRRRGDHKAEAGHANCDQHEVRQRASQCDGEDMLTFDALPKNESILGPNDHDHAQK